MYLNPLLKMAAPALVTLTLLTACGGSDGTDTPEASLTKQEPGSSLTKQEPGSSLEAEAAASAAPASIESASVVVDFAAEQGDLMRTERYNTWDNGDPAPDLRAGDVEFLDEHGLRSDLVRMGFSVDEHCDVAANSCDFSSIADWIGDISDSTDSLMVHLTPKHLIEEKRPPADAKPLLTLAIRELKKQYPNVDYIEATNEPDWEFHGKQVYARKAPILQPDEVYAYYVPYYQAVNEVNKGLPESEKIKIGGPTLTGMTELWTTAFLDGYAADQNPDKRLDFISYHGYGEFSDDFKQYRAYKADPSEIGGQRARLDNWLKERQLPEGIPVYVTETGLYPGPSFDEKDPSKNDYIRQAAGMASMFYWWADQSEVYPFNWVVRHATQGRKDQLITHAPEGPQVDTFSPYGNMLLMQSMMKDTRVKATSDSLKDGQGVYALAAKDTSGVSVMVWNYQHTNNGSFQTTIDMSQLQSVLKDGPVRQKLYRIDQNTSNYWTNPEAANLQLVSESVVEPGESYSIPVNLSANALELIVLEPVE
ncbi:hypothetical protein [Pseudomaricurvus sp.]|uniref:hypothetical protein n=1 Tax=Pseudomaricurvus sp. TaxID=2004510 RepID=UPI003F6BB3FF